MRPYLLLDAGGTILFPDFHFMHIMLLQHGYGVPEERLNRIGTEWIRQLDERLKRDGRDDTDLPAFLTTVLRDVGVRPQDMPAVIEQMNRVDIERSLWTYTYPWVREALARLSAQGYRMSVVSNADGRVRAQLGYAGLAQYFEQVFDSKIVGYEKPDPRIFQHALKTLCLGPDECLFVGDVYYIDVLGANGVGMAAVHLDPYGLYGDWPGRHIRSVADLPDLLASPDLDMQDEALFPLRQPQVEQAKAPPWPS